MPGSRISAVLPYALNYREPELKKVLARKVKALNKNNRKKQTSAKNGDLWRRFADNAGAFFRKMTVFVNRHKIIVSIVAVVILLVSAVFGVVNHYLNKINFDDGSVSLATQNVSVQTVRLFSGETVNLAGLKRNSDGTYTLSDGRIVDEYGSVWLQDGSVIFYDGSYILTDGTAVLSDGTTIYTSTDVVFQDGTSLPSSGITVDKEGYATFKDKTELHISAFTLSKDGKVILKPDDQVAEKYRVKDGSSDNLQIGNNDDNDDDIISAAKTDEKTKDTLLQNDESIKNNILNKKIWYSDDIVNILIMGIDYGSSRFPNGRSDAMMIASINKKTKKIKLVSLARSAYVAISGYENTRLNHAHGYGGPALAIDTIQNNYKIRIDNYVSTTFDTFKQLIDQLGGVNITLTAAEAKALKSKLVSGGYTYKGAAAYKLNGTLALEYVRLRKIDSDRQRTQRQRNVLTSIANQVKSMNVFEMNALLNKILPLIRTNLTKTEILAQIPNVPSFLSGNIEQSVLPHKCSPLTLRDGFEVAIIDWDEEVAYTHKLFYGDVQASYIE